MLETSALIAFEPRQIMLAKQQKMKNKKSSLETLENDLSDKALIQKSSKKDKKKKSSTKDSSPLLLSIAEFLEHKGFSKTLAAFKSEALIEELDGLKGHSLDLEAMYYRHLETSKCDGKVNNSSSEKLDLQIEGVAEKDKGDAAIKSVSKVKKREHKGNDTDDSVDKLTNEAAADFPVKSKDKKKKSKLVSDSSGENTQKVGSEVFQEPANNMVCETQVDEPDRKYKDKKKKKSKPTSESLVESVEQGGPRENGTLDKSAAENISSEGSVEEKNVKSKDKKRKKNKLTTESLSEDKENFERGDSKKTDPKKENLLTLESSAVNTNKKESKKRKRLGSEDNESQPDEIESKESKQSKTKGSEKDMGKDNFLKANALLESDGHAGKKRKMENGQHESDTSFKSPLNEQPSATEKSGKKQLNGSAEPKTINAFRRVDIEKVEFVDERLQDNSYWAKDGADSGYGAKAQEVLGQVRGRDFRHEKTKKKRGSYRGGQIDLQSHSIKFNYSDEE
ncbi:LisH dimerization motif [Macleaya cordata]|uniref:LisH dimerization motif n=1 Tax=Macleaya cordata TaxID=56857 RepID=A0A200QAN7_MACCD|nr:LisH dimerization motif [Macleaya cordata]